MTATRRQVTIAVTRGMTGEIQETTAEMIAATLREMTHARWAVR
jgi:hypothetical protein